LTCLWVNLVLRNVKPLSHSWIIDHHTGLVGVIISQVTINVIDDTNGSSLVSKNSPSLVGDVGRVIIHLVFIFLVIEDDKVSLELLVIITLDLLNLDILVGLNGSVRDTIMFDHVLADPLAVGSILAR
jgi:hypothetical protein